MAEETSDRGRGRRQSEEPEKQEERKPTRRKILKRERVIVVPDAAFGADGKPVEAWAETLTNVGKAMGLRASKPVDTTEAWLVVGENEELSELAAIEAHAGKRNTPDAKPGIWKAVSERSWKGGLVYERPPEPKVEASAFED